MPRTATLLALALLALTPHVQAINILISNDDGWAASGIRAFHDALVAEGHKVLLSAPAYNESGRGELLTTPEPLTSEGEFDSIPSGSPAEGNNASDPSLWYVNATPASSVRFALDNLTATYFGGPPDLVVTGVNAGANVGLAYLVSGTFGAAKYAIQQGLPAIAFSGANGTQRSYTTITGPDDPSSVYGQLATKIVTAVIAAGPPYLPNGTGINVNFPQVSSACPSASSFAFVQTRLLDTITHPDACLCGQTSDCRLPTESDVVSEGCNSTLSLFNTDIIGPDASAAQQMTLNKRISSLLTCAN